MNTPQSSVTQVALTRAIALLKAAGVEYAIRTPEGEMHGDLEVVTRKKGASRKKVNNFQEMFPGYIQQIAGMKTGDVLKWNAGVELAEAFRKCVSSMAAHRLGRGNCISVISGEDKATVELLRVE